jgi:hypothetical protein
MSEDTFYVECPKHPNSFAAVGEPCANCDYEREHDESRFPEGAEL